MTDNIFFTMNLYTVNKNATICLNLKENATLRIPDRKHHTICVPGRKRIVRVYRGSNLRRDGRKDDYITMLSEPERKHIWITWQVVVRYVFLIWKKTRKLSIYYARV